MLGGSGSMKNRKTIDGQATRSRCQPPRASASAGGHDRDRAPSRRTARSTRRAGTAAPAAPTSGARPHHRGASCARSSRPRRLPEDRQRDRDHEEPVRVVRVAVPLVDQAPEARRVRPAERRDDRARARQARGAQPAGPRRSDRESRHDARSSVPGPRPGTGRVGARDRPARTPCPWVAAVAAPVPVRLVSDACSTRPEDHPTDRRRVGTSGRPDNPAPMRPRRRRTLATRSDGAIRSADPDLEPLVAPLAKSTRRNPGPGRRSGLVTTNGFRSHLKASSVRLDRLSPSYPSSDGRFSPRSPIPAGECHKPLRRCSRTP